MAPEIRELDAETRDRIAAGEVVERPASVVKELVENALDADASRVDVTVEAGGKDRIVVADDGVGMSETDARAAVKEHTTSKLRDVSDLDTIGTLGFRGEALHAIGSVARLRLRTKPRDGTRGTELVVEGGDVVDCGPVGCPEGTTVEVTALFENVPARRKYLKTDTTEFDHVQQVVAGYALAAPDVAVRLDHDGRETFATPGDGDRQSAVLDVYGREVAASMVSVEQSWDDGPVAGVAGLVSHPETNRAGRDYMTTLVNGRYVTASAVREAIVEAYGRQLAADRYPFAVIDIDLPPGGVDVNVHPRKLEVLFSDEKTVRERVKNAVESALLDAGLLRSRAPRGQSAPEQTEIPSDEEPPRTESGHRRRPAVGSSSTSGRAADSTEQSNAAADARGEPPAASGGGTESDATASSDGTTESDATGPANASNDGPAPSPDESPGDAAADAAPPTAGESPAVARDDADSESTADAAASAPDGTDRFRAATTQRTLDGETTTGTPETFDRLPSMTVFGQFDDTYLVAEADDGLVLIDQHAADERINYERLKAAVDGDLTTQALAEPVSVSLTAREAALVEEYGEALSRLGFRVRTDDDRTLTVTTAPALLVEAAGDAMPELARDLLGEFTGGNPDSTVAAVVDDLLGDLACHPSIKGNTSLREGTVEGLLSALDGCENPYACPHGRPTVLELSREEIETRFERDYPGHGDRRQ